MSRFEKSNGSPAVRASILSNGAHAFQASVFLRIVAFAIAIAAIVDPALTVFGASRPRVAIVPLRPATASAGAVRDRLARDLSASYEVVPTVTSDAAAAIVIGSHYSLEPGALDGGSGSGVPDTLLVATVTVSEAIAPGVRIVRVEAPREVPPGTAIHVDVALEARGVSGKTTEVTASLAGLESSPVSHRWTNDHERWAASLDVVPIGGPPYVVRVRLPPSPGGFGGTGTPDTTETTDTAPVASGYPVPPKPPGGEGGSRTMADVVVDVRHDPLRVEFYDARPSWATTFVRRALEGDARFEVATLSDTSRGVSAQTGGAVPLGDPRIDSFDVVVVGGLDRLSTADVRSLDRYARERGGAVVVVPDERIDAGPARDFVEGQELIERLLEQPATLVVAAPAASLRASELLVLRSLLPMTDVIARVPGTGVSAAAWSPVIVSMPRGDGRLMLSGAMDAWRYRAADNGAFDRFWQSTIAGLALAVPPPIAIDTEPRLLRPGDWSDVTVRVRSRDIASVSASLDGVHPIRLLPEPETGRYRGRFLARDTPGRSTIEVRAASAVSEGFPPHISAQTILVQADIRRPAPTSGASLAMLASSHRGIDVTPERVADLEAFLRGVVSRPRVSEVRHPMRSVWWIVPFAGCLSAEWWMRRRRGLR
jgi:hypothetical protein